ncbi:phospholipase A2 [Streptomyces sp. NPDC089915]|uniref:phospholipase A2 n=1 Tax=Streptomyces sp. NPDC089915 TaxID=3155186 RepID=UPI00341903A7
MTSLFRSSPRRVPARRRKTARIACWSLAGTLAGALAWTTAFGPGLTGTPGRSDTVAIAASTVSQDPVPMAMEQIVAAGDSAYALAADHQAVYEWSTGQANWQKIRGAAQKLYAGGDRLYAIEPGSGDISRYGGEPNQWTRIGGPGATFAATSKDLYGISPDHSGVWKYSGRGDVWNKVGDPAGNLYTGPDKALYATNPVTKDIVKYDGGRWKVVGGPGAAFAVTDNNFYGLTPDHKAVVEYDAKKNVWNPVGGPAGTILASNTLYATRPDTGELYKYNGSPGKWNRVSGAAAAFATSGDHLYRLAPDKLSVQRYAGSGADDKWADLGAPPASAVPATPAEKLARLDALTQLGDKAFGDWVETRAAHQLGKPDRYEFNWTTNGCNDPAPNRLGTYDFTFACIRHDFGYRNYKDLQGEDVFQHGADWNSPKDRVDRIFHQDLLAVCDEMGFPVHHTATERAACVKAADVYFAAVVVAS